MNYVYASPIINTERGNLDIMRPNKFFTATIQEVFKKKKVATINELKGVLGANEKTVFRKLKELSYRTSYTHSGQFYTLSKMASFDSSGLWTYKSIKFSKYGTLLKTANIFVDNAEKGYTARELGNILNVEVKKTLLELFKKDLIDREKISGYYIYCSRNTSIRRKQIRYRKSEEKRMPYKFILPKPKILANELKAAIIIFFSILNEKQRRLYAGLESMKIGQGGDSIISEMLNINDKTVRRGKNELLGQTIDNETIRNSGGGRKEILKKNASTLEKNRSINGI